MSPQLTPVPPQVGAFPGQGAPADAAGAQTYPPPGHHPSHAPPMGAATPPPPQVATQRSSVEPGPRASRAPGAGPAALAAGDLGGMPALPPPTVFAATLLLGGPLLLATLVVAVLALR